ncbi:MAG: hypothetical protein JSS31_00090 [Proteobacteria bacterium]|nr:hypothetical protein [Pseudomonadota bacterium]MBS0492351.1 hypothetical protein [Pseudomonadota bacterium]
MKDESVIPPGHYCYRVRKVAPNEVLSDDIERFGKDLREYYYGGGFKEILCPYWQLTDYGMVRCEFLGVEGLDESRGAKAKALHYYKTEELFNTANKSHHYLSDEIKICGIAENQDEDWDCVAS